MDYQFKIMYVRDKKQIFTDGDTEDFTIDCKEDSKRLTVTVNPKRNISFSYFSIQIPYTFDDSSVFFANGYQSWTDSREFTKYDTMSDIGTIGKTLIGKSLGLNYVGDYNFAPKIKGKGVFCSHSFGYARLGEKVDLFSSVDDSTGFTMIVAEMNNNSIRIFKDLEGVTVRKPYVALDLYFDSGTYDEVFDNYFDVLGIKALTNDVPHGYTSWYNHYQNISSSIILHDLNSMSQMDGVDTFQIDDGYQTAVGDWLSVDINKFPSGMKAMADEIHNKGYKAGLWLAPFGAQKGSFLAEKHKSWLVSDKHGRPITVGANWGGFYAIDIYNIQARKYIKQVFDTVLNVWGFDLVKLDFLYAASIIPLYGKSRGQIAYDAMELLRECVGDKKILGCGCQMMPAFGKVDYMRIGADMSLSWAHTVLRKNMHREDVSTPNAVRNSVYRRCLDGRAFLNDTDVFLLRSDNIGFSEEQRELLAKFISIFGNVMFTSDDVSTYTNRQKTAFDNTMTVKPKLLSVDENDNIMTVHYKEDNEEKSMTFNVLTGEIL